MARSGGSGGEFLTPNSVRDILTKLRFDTTKLGSETTIPEQNFALERSGWVLDAKSGRKLSKMEEQLEEKLKCQMSQNGFSGFDSGRVREDPGDPWEPLGTPGDP